MSKKRISRQATLFLALFALMSCADRESVFNATVGSWEGTVGPGRTFCVTLHEDLKVDLFNRMPKIAPLTSNAEAEKEVADADNTDIEMGTSYSAGYWTVARGNRFWQVGALIRNHFGEEQPESSRVPGRGDWYVLEFDGPDTHTAIKIKDKRFRRTLHRVADCKHYEKDVNMQFIEPVYPPES